MELTREQLLDIYRNMVRSRAFEELVISARADWKIPASWMSGIGQEGVVGALSTLLDGDYVTLNRDACQHRTVRLPVSLVGGLLRKPPDQEQAEDR